MRYWLDTEFLEDEYGLRLISIGIVAQDGREYYAESNEMIYDHCGDWLQENVIPHLSYNTATWRTEKQIAEDILKFVGTDSYPEFWGYFADYDWVLFCRLFGGMLDLPKGWPQFCLDLKQLVYLNGDFQLPAHDLDMDGGPEHHALADARWTKRAWGAAWMKIYGPTTK